MEVMEKRLSQLAQTPGQGPIKYEDVCCRLVMDFPYLIHYGVNLLQKQLIIYRIFDASRKPLWD